MSAMYAVCISLGASSAYVSVAALPAASSYNNNNDEDNDNSKSASASHKAAATPPPIRIVANAAGHRSTPMVAALSEHEVLFGDIAVNAYARQPQTVVPYVFPYAAAAAAVADTASNNTDDDDKGNEATPKTTDVACGGVRSVTTAADTLLRVVRAASRVRFAGHCPLDEVALHTTTTTTPSAATTTARTHAPQRRLGFYYGEDNDEHNNNNNTDNTSQRPFVAAEDLFVRYLNHIKRHVLDAACNLTESNDNGSEPTTTTAAGGGGSADKDGAGATASSRARLVVTVVVPRYAFPAAALPLSSSARATATQWLREAVYASHIGNVAAQVMVLFRDEAAFLAYKDEDEGDGGNKGDDKQADAHTDGAVATTRAAADCHLVLVVDWGAHTLSISALRECGGMLLDVHAPVHSNEGDARDASAGSSSSSCCPYMCFTSTPSPCTAASAATATHTYWGTEAVCGGDAVDVALAERVAAQFVSQHRRRLSSSTAALSPAVLAQAGRTLLSRDTSTTTAALQQCIPPRALRRLRLLMTDKKAALMSNAQAMSVAVEVEAFVDGIDLHDTQTLSKHKVDAAVRGEWAVAAQLEAALHCFLARNATLLRCCRVGGVYLLGGMCQVTSAAALLRQVVVQQLQPFAATAAAATARPLCVRDATQTRHTGTALAGDEVAVVGGCYHSYDVAQTLLRERAARQRLRAAARRAHGGNSGKKSKGKPQTHSGTRTASAATDEAAVAAVQTHKCTVAQLAAVRQALCTYGTSKDDEDDEVDKDVDGDNKGHADAASAARGRATTAVAQLAQDGRCVAFLDRNVYVYCGHDTATLQACVHAAASADTEGEDGGSDRRTDTCDTASSTAVVVHVPQSSLALLFARHTPLPSRVVVPLPPPSSHATDGADDTTVLYLFTDATDATAQHGGGGSDKGAAAGGVRGRGAHDEQATTSAVTATAADATMPVRALTERGVVVPRTARARDRVVAADAAAAATTASSHGVTRHGGGDDEVVSKLVLTMQLHTDDDGVPRAVLTVQGVVAQQSSSSSHDTTLFVTDVTM